MSLLLERSDDHGNKLVLTNEYRIFLFLNSGERREIGWIANRVLELRKKPSYLARGKGHYHFKADGWPVNYDVIKHHDAFGFDRVNHIGFDQHDVEFTINRSAEEILRDVTPDDFIHFKGQGFERQIVLRKDAFLRQQPVVSGQASFF